MSKSLRREPRLPRCISCGEAFTPPHARGHFKGNYCQPCKAHWEEHKRFPEGK